MVDIAATFLAGVRARRGDGAEVDMRTKEAAEEKRGGFNRSRTTERDVFARDKWILRAVRFAGDKRELTAFVRRDGNLIFIEISPPPPPPPHSHPDSHSHPDPHPPYPPG